jgi:hypothetical protein
MHMSLDEGSGYNIWETGVSRQINGVIAQGSGGVSRAISEFETVM